MRDATKTGKAEHAAIYIRCSTGPDDKWSLQAQEENLTKFAISNGWSYEIYNEGIVSGVTIADRPVMRRLLRDAESNKFTVCLVIEFERLTRSQDLLDLIEIKKTFREHNIKIQTPSQAYDLSLSEDDFLSDLFGILAKREKQKTAERSKRGMEKARQSGAYTGGVAPFGYRHSRKSKDIVPVEEEAQVVRYMFDLAETKTAYGISKELYKMGFKTKQGCNWTPDTVRKVLKRLTYAGKRELKDGTIIDLKIEPIITYEQFKKVELRKKRSNANVHNTNLKYLLSGVLRCPYCGRSVCSWTEKRRLKNGKMRLVKYYSCNRVRSNQCPKSKLIRMDLAERIVVEAVKYALSGRKALRIAHENSGHFDATRTIKEDMVKEQAKIEDVKQRKNNLIDAVMKGIITDDDAKDKMKSVNDQISFHEGKLLDLQKQANENEYHGFEGVSELVARFNELFDQSDTLRQRDLLKSVLEKGELFVTKIVLHFRFPVNRDGTNTFVIHINRTQGDKAPKADEKKPQKITSKLH